MWSDVLNCSNVLKDSVLKTKANNKAIEAKAKDLQKKQSQGQGTGTKAKAKKCSRPTPRTYCTKIMLTRGKTNNFRPLT